MFIFSDHISWYPTERTGDPHGGVLSGAEGVCSSEDGFPLALLTMTGQMLAAEMESVRPSMEPGMVSTFT